METRKSRASKKKHDFLRGVIGRMMMEQGDFTIVFFITIQSKRRDKMPAYLVPPSISLRLHLF